VLIDNMDWRFVMAVSKRGMRKVTLKGREYIWYVKDVDTLLPDEGFVEQTRAQRYLHIISTNKKFIVHYRIPHPGDPHTELQVEGPLFPRAPGLPEVEVPRWRHDSKRYPTADFVRRLIGWCMEDSEVS
jgi:hypothetical protein